MVETTYRQGLKEDLEQDQLEKTIIHDLNKLDLIDIDNIDNN